MTFIHRERGVPSIRAATETIREKRKSRESVILLTGGTGFLGGHLAAVLLKKGYRVVLLARPTRELSGEERLAHILSWLGVSPEHRRTFRVIEGSIEKRNLGLDSGDYRRLTGEVDEIIHCASNTAFSERKRLEVERTNVDGLSNLLDFAASGACFYFHHVSTAFVAGRRTGSCAEELMETGGFTNVYEETKYRGEVMARQRCSAAGIRLNVYRPAIVYGNSKNGRSSKFNGLYYPIRVLLFLKNLYEKDIKENGGVRAREIGVETAKDGSLYMPIRIRVSNGGGINLIPVDYFTDAFTAIMDECVEGGIFHITNNELKSIEDIISYTRRFFRLSGIEVCRDGRAGEASPGRSALESLFDLYNEAYGPYIRDHRIFLNSSAEAALRKRGLTCPDFDYRIFSRCMNYALESEWGKNLRRPPCDPEEKGA